MNVRELVLDMLLELETAGTYSNVLIRNVLDKYDYLEGQEKAFIKRVTEGTLERSIQLDYVIDAYSKVPVQKMKPLIRCLLRMSVYQILFMDGVPDAAVCNEAVKLAMKRKFQNLKGFVNGVLRNIARNKEKMMAGTKESLTFYPDRDKETVRYLSVVYSMPEHLIKLWLKNYDIEQTEQMLEAMLKVHPVTIRMQETLDEKRKKQLLQDMEKSGIEVREHPYLSYAYQLTHLDGVRNVPGYEEGYFAVQDVSSMLCVECAGIQEGNLVVDVCAAPGGKTMLAAEKLKGTGKVIARDVSEDKVAYIEENRERLKLENVVTEVFDATVYDGSLEQQADVVLADLPCSGLGILGKKRDIKYNVTGEMLKELPELQKKILDTVWRYVKPGGILLYSTCTIHQEENEQIVKWLTENYPFETESIYDLLGNIPEKESGKNGYIQLLPRVHETDGFFIARLRRKQNE